MSYAESRLEISQLRLAREGDRLSDALARRLARDEAQARADDAAEAQERRDRARRDAERCAEHQVRYDIAFQKLGRRAPQPVADAHPPTYRRELFGIGQTMLPSGHELADIDPEELSPSTVIPFEKQLLEALEAEGEQPTGDNVPQSVSDPRAMRVRQDDTGRRIIEYHAKRSFIHDLKRPTVHAVIHDPRTLRGAQRLVSGMMMTQHGV